MRNFPTNFATGIALVAACMSLAIGCRGSNVSVTGVVLHKGQPVPGLVVYFHPDEGPAAWGQTSDRGEFELLSDGGSLGVPPGDYTVCIEYDPRPSDPTEVMYPQMGTPASRPADIDALLAKYGSRQKSPLRISIMRDSGPLKLELD